MKQLLLRISLSLLALFLLLIGSFVILAWAPDRPVSALQARWAPPPSVFVEVAGMRVHLRDQGPRNDPRPIVLLHGTSASLHTWEGWATQLSQTHRVIRFDLPGFGLTGPAPDGNYTIAAYVRFVRAMLDHLGVSHCVLAGNSLGGSIAWETAAALPERVDRLILVDAGGYPLHATSVPIGFRLAGLWGVNRLMRVTLPRRVIESSVRNVFGDPDKVTPELIDRYYELTLRAGYRQALAQRFQLSSAAADESGRIAQLKLPTLILWGGRDHLIPPGDAERFHHDIAGSRVVMFDDLGHTPQEEDPARTAASVQEFLQ